MEQLANLYSADGSRRRLRPRLGDDGREHGRLRHSADPGNVFDYGSRRLGKCAADLSRGFGVGLDLHGRG